MPTAQDRLQASIVRVNAGRIAAIVTIGTMDLKTMVGVVTPTGIALDAEWLARADDVAIDDVLKHELVHYACTPDGERIADVIGDLGAYAEAMHRDAMSMRARRALDVAGDTPIDAVPTVTAATSEGPAGHAGMPDHEGRGIHPAVAEYLKAVMEMEPIAMTPLPNPPFRLETLKKVDEIMKRPLR